MAEYKVFISHSTRDAGLVIALSDLLTKLGLKVFVAEWYLEPGGSLAKKVFRLIESADCIIVLLTKNGIRSNWVQQEIGYAIKANKFIIPLVEKGVEIKDLGALQGKEYIEYDSLQPQQALVKAATYIKSLSSKKGKREKKLVIVGGIIAFLLLLLFSGGER